MTAKQTVGVSKSLRHLACAELTFSEAQGLAELLKELDHGSTPYFLTSPMMAGIVVTYARNFTDSNGMKGLFSDYTQFPELTLQQTHDSLMQARHTIYAHRDYTALSQRSDPSNPERKGHDVAIIFHEQFTGFDFDVASPQQDPGTLPEIIRLCMFQRNRIVGELKVMIEHCLPDDHSYEVGKAYSIGKDFPQPSQS